MDSSNCDREWLSSVKSQSSIRYNVLPLANLSFIMNLVNFSVFLLVFIQIISTSHALPIVDKGVFVITGVKTCGVNGSGYCVLGPDCSVDKEFEPMLDDPNDIEIKIEEITTLPPTLEDLINSPLKSQIKNFAKPKNHCDGLRNAFTPSAEFSCCQYVNTSVNNTQSLNQYFGQNVVTNTSSGVSLVTKPQNGDELDKPEVVEENVELNTGNYFTKISTITSTSVSATTEQSNSMNTAETNDITTSTTTTSTTSKTPNVNKTNQNTSSASEESKSEESQEDGSKSKESPESDEKEPEMSIESELENIHKPDGIITSNKTLENVNQTTVVESTTIETQTEINLLQESISVVHLTDTDQVHHDLPIEPEPVEKAKDDKNLLKEEIEQLLDKCNSNSNFSPRKTHSDIFSQYKYANVGTNRRLIANNNDNKGRVAIPGYGNQNIFKNSGEECHYTVAIVRRPSLLTSFSNVNTFSDPGSFICAGALVSSRVIVTSATCVSRLIFINNSYFKQSFRNNGRNATNSNSKEDELIYNQYLQMFRVVIGTKHILHPSRLYRLLLSNPNAFENTSNEINMREIERIKIHDGYKLLNAATSTGEQSHNIRVNDIALVILKKQAYEGVKNITEHQKRDLKNLKNNKKYIVNHDDDEEPMVDDELEEFEDLDDDHEELLKPNLHVKKTKINSPQQNQNSLDFQQEINMDVKVCPICLPSYNHQGSGEHVDTNNYNQCLVTGYSHPTSESSSESDGIFHEAHQEIHNQDDNCLFYSNTFYDESSQNNNNHTDSNYNIKNTVLCASSGNNAEACFSPRDSGSPLSCSSRKSENKFLLGVFSNGFHCAGSNSPVLYTDVRNYVNWILENV